MIKYFIKPGQRGLIKFDAETEELDSIGYMTTHIDWMYEVPEDGMIQFPEPDGTMVTKSVKKYDFVIQFYESEGNKHNIIVIKSKEWKENIKSQEAYAEKLRKDRLKKCNCEGPCCDECCEGCCASA